MMIAQIYEIQTPQEAEKAVALGVDHLGSVILSAGHRHLRALKEVVRVAHQAGAKSSLIPLFHQEEILFSELDFYGPDFVHLCDSLTDHNGRERDLGRFIRLQEKLKEKFPEIGIMRSIPIPMKNAWSDFPTLRIARQFEPVSDVFLTDTWLGREPVEGYIGITGKEADWGLAKELVRQSGVPVILAGGLSPGNVIEAVLKVLPAGADSCTRTNRMDAEGVPIRFQKDFKKVEEFVKGVRKAEALILSRRMELAGRLADLRTEQTEREAALPAHSVRPHQLLAIEEVEEEIARIEEELDRLREPKWKSP